MTDTYRTLENSGRAEHTVDGSRFLAEAVAVANRTAAEEAITAVRTREHKATHHCSAYRLGAAGDTFRYDDDGEPSGTAGRPILRQIDAHDLTDTLIVVTRYFGGTELGTGGLARAYGDAAAAALEQAECVERVVRTPVQIRYEYDDTAPAERVLRQFDADVWDSEYTDVTTLTVGVRASRVEEFVEAFRNALSARGELIRVGGEEAAGG
ncbi:IMPACT family protein [Salinibacter grassmerensis]|uniref:IMPACT family protein n=1 Tax=Salinibacter grassmerensis TaxID=3040353 RepID=UPI0021E86F9E|nr:YigZ family protein [Salinibacter grassmerensis]